MTATPPAAMSNSQQSPWGPSASGQTLEQGTLNPSKLLQIIRRRGVWFGITFSVVFASVGVVTLGQWIFNPQYRGGFRLLVRDPLAEKQGPETSELAAVARLSSTVNVPNLVEVLKSPMILEPLAERLGLPKGSLQQSVSIGRSRQDTDVLNINLIWNNPKKGATIIEALSKDYLDYAQRQRREKLTQGLKFLDEQAPGLQQRVMNLQQELSIFRRVNTMLAPEEQSRGLELSRAQLASEVRTLNQTAAQLQGLLAMVRSGSLVSPFQGTSTEISADSTTNPAANIQNSFSPLLQELVGVEGELAAAESSFRLDSPLVRNLRARRNRLRPLLQSREQDAIVSAIQVNLVQQQKVQDQIDNLGDEFRRNPDLIKRYEGLQQRLEVARENLGSYLKARETFRLEVAQSTTPWQLISPPQFGVVPVEPNLQSRLLMGLLLGVVLGAGVAYTRDLLDNVFHSKKEVEEILGLPILGTVPYLVINTDDSIPKSVEQLDPEEGFALRESLRSFYQSLRTLRANRTLRVVALTSSSSSEGKSTTSALLGQTLVDMGMKVLLVDADLRRSKLHRRLGGDNAHGLSELFGENPPPLEQLYQWINPGLALLSGGPQLPDPARLLSSPRCSEIISEIRSQHQFDLIIFDTPPALELVDPLLIAEHMDGLILLVSIGKVKRNLPSIVIRKCQSSEVDLLGVVTNSRVDSYSTFGGYGYGYGDRYGYGTGYVHNYVNQEVKEDD